MEGERIRHERKNAPGMPLRASRRDVKCTHVIPHPQRP
jgi:hypothetical protein